MKLSSQRLCPERLHGGVWWDYETKTACPGNKPHLTNPCFRVIPAVASRLAVALAEEQRPHIEVLRKPSPDENASFMERDDYRRNVNAITRRTRAAAIVRTTLVGWTGLEDDDGSPIEFSIEKAREILSDLGYTQILEFVESAAMSVDAAREEAEAAKN